ncbi:hypothetical protein AVEN_203354-1 [Araneus ventricosus]|uniref:Uncharacterized protein n=1 Tax=Araneus ventricosus TaxID=182803 RepID=A0A4Y2WA18_ARAVE|nr:hypothetical protein AVEN_203354-1 [Araneus ventricosus]
MRSEMKTRELMFRESLRISYANLSESHEDEREKIRKFQEGEKRRYKAEQQRQELKHKKQLDLCFVQLRIAQRNENLIPLFPAPLSWMVHLQISR